MERIGRAARVACSVAVCGGLLLAAGAAAAQEESGAIVVTGEEIRLMKANKMADVLNHVPGVTAGDSSVGIHGSYKVKVLVDGRPINDPTSSVGGVNWSMVSPDKIERIEILRGKGGVRYGQDASGGVILITTRAISSVSGQIKSYGGNQDTGFVSVAAQAQAGRWGAEASGETETTQGYVVNNDSLRHKGGVKAAYSLDADRALSLGADYVEEEKGLTGQPDHPTPFSRKESETTALSAQGKYFRTASSTFFNAGRQRNTDVSKNLDQSLRVNELGEDLSSAMDTGKFGELAYGVGYRMGQASGSTFADQSEDVFSLFASQSLQSQTSPWALTGGLRANANTAFEDVLNPELKLVYQQQGWNLTGAYSGSNNIPSFYQRYNHSSSTLPNPDLGMETADNYSLALFVQPRPALSGRVSVFYNLLNDRITYVTFDDGVGQYQNFGKVSYKGGDLSMTWKARPDLGFKASYTYLRATDEETGLLVPAKAEHQASLEGCWQVTEQLTTVLSGKYASEVYRNKANTKTVPGSLLGNFRAEYSLGRYALFTEIKNFADTTYYYADGLLAPPLTWMAGLSWKF